MTNKYIIQMGVESNLGTFDIQDMLELMFQEKIDRNIFINHIPVNIRQVKTITDNIFDLEGLIKQGGSISGHFNIVSNNKEFVRITEIK